MKRRSITRIGMLLTAMLTFAACGNNNPEMTLALRQIPQMFSDKAPPPQQVSQQRIARTLAATSASLLVVELDRYKAQTLVQEIERNGAYQSYGNVARNGIVIRDGMITATRGLGGDLMSSEEDALLARVKGRAAGSVSYDQRFITPEDVTVVRRYVCNVTGGGTIPVAAGAINTTGRLVTAACTAADGVSPDFTNIYAVSSDGYILSAKQWVGPTIGYLNTQVLRR